MSYNVLHWVGQVNTGLVQPCLFSCLCLYSVYTLSRCCGDEVMVQFILHSPAAGMFV